MARADGQLFQCGTFCAALAGLGLLHGPSWLAVRLCAASAFGGASVDQVALNIDEASEYPGIKRAMRCRNPGNDASLGGGPPVALNRRNRVLLSQTPFTRGPHEAARR